MIPRLDSGRWDILGDGVARDSEPVTYPEEEGYEYDYYGEALEIDEYYGLLWEFEEFGDLPV